jgi:hypothetical protein
VSYRRNGANVVVELMREMVGTGMQYVAMGLSKDGVNMVRLISISNA